MRATHRLGAAVVALLAAVLLSGCLKLDADFSVSDDDTVNGKFTVAVDRHSSSSPVRRQLLTEQVRGIEAHATEPGQRHRRALRGRQLPRRNGDLRRRAARRLQHARRRGPDNALTITHNGDQFEVTGELDFELGGLPSGGGVPNVGALLDRTEPELRIALTFPGEVT